jgi:putative oxidoreductase
MQFHLSRYQPQVLSILRIMAGLLFLSSGLQKWFGFPVANPSFAKITLFSMLGFAGLIEMIGGALVTVGLFTRAAAFIMSGEMAVAYFQFHWKLALGTSILPIVNKGELAVLYCFVFLVIFLRGPGPLSLDRVLRRA